MAAFTTCSNARHVLGGLLLWLLVGSVAAPESRSSELREISTSRPGQSASESDTLRTYAFGEVLVAAPSPGVIAEPGQTEVPVQVIESHDVDAAAGLESLLPGSNITTNSRGEANLTLRGASERQVAVFQDGVRLNLSWDERVDLSLVPLQAVGSIRVTRGLGSVLDGPNTLGGVVHMVTRHFSTDEARTRVLVEGGEIGRFRGSLLHLRRSGDWSYLAAVQHRRRDGFLLPAGYAADYNQGTGRTRTNSDLEQSSVLVRVARHLPHEGSVGLSFHGIDSSKGVPPESHLTVDDARYWRVPRWRRGLISLHGDLIPDEERLWSFRGGLSLDLFEQRIQYYGDSSYRDGAADDYEAAEDVTVAARVRLRRSSDREGTRTLGWAGSLRLTEHEERESASSAFYRQVLWGSGVEWQGRVTGPWLVRAGGGIDGAATPKTGGRPAQDADLAPNLGLRITRDLAENAQVHVSLGRRARFPSLRERYDDAGGVFAVNPELNPEVQTSAELAGGIVGERWSLTAGVFAKLLEDGIVRVRVTDDTGESVRRRVNEDRIRGAGLELAGHGELGADWRVDAHYSYLHLRARDDAGDYDELVERKPVYNSAITIQGPVPRLPALDLQLEVTMTGSFRSLDDRSGDLVPISSAQTANLRLAYRWVPTAGRPWTGTAFVRVDNLADAEVLSQLGLPEPGREVRLGIKWER